MYWSQKNVSENVSKSWVLVALVCNRGGWHAMLQHPQSGWGCTSDYTVYLMSVFTGKKKVQVVLLTSLLADKADACVTT